MTGSWVPGADGSGFGSDHLPYGVVSGPDGVRRPAVRIGDFALPLSALAGEEHGEGADRTSALLAASLDPLLALGRPVWQWVRAAAQELVTEDRHRAAAEPFLLPIDSVTAHLPFTVADYVDFYSSQHHATNVGRIFRPDGDALTPNWKHLPIGYHGRSGTVVVSGTDVVRPSGQRKAPADPAPTYGPSQKLDIEAEVGFVVGVPSSLGSPVPASSFADHVFGVVLVNDWSARDLQAWEYVPLGPFLGKSFATSVAAWITPLEALEPARVPGPAQEPEPLPYLRGGGDWGLDLTLEVEWNGTVVARPPFASMYWSPAQQLAHLTGNGASLRTGDLYASGTVSGPGRDQRGSFLELSWNGTEPVTLDDGSVRTFLEDGDVVTLRAGAPGADGSRLRLGEVTGRITPTP